MLNGTLMPPAADVFTHTQALSENISPQLLHLSGISSMQTWPAEEYSNFGALKLPTVPPFQQPVEGMGKEPRSAAQSQSTPTHSSSSKPSPPQQRAAVQPDHSAQAGLSQRSEEATDPIIEWDTNLAQTDFEGSLFSDAQYWNQFDDSNGINVPSAPYDGDIEMEDMYIPMQPVVHDGLPFNGQYVQMPQYVDPQSIIQRSLQ